MDEVTLEVRMNGVLSSTATQPRLPLQINRDVYTYDAVLAKYGKTPSGEKLTRVKKAITDCTCSGRCLKRFFFSRFPILKIVHTYNVKEYLVSDMISGISSAFILFPQGLAFGILSSLSPAHGLYSSFFPVLLYMIFGTSQHMSFGTNAVISLATAELVDLAADEKFPDRNSVTNVSSNETGLLFPDNIDVLAYKASVAAGASFLSGLILFVMSVCRLGFITSYLSTAFIGGFTTAAAFHIFTSQLPKALGLTVPTIAGAGKLVLLYVKMFQVISEINWGSLIAAIITGVVIVFVKDFINERFKRKLCVPIPIDLLVVTIATMISYFAELQDKYGIEEVGDIPNGIPRPELPNLQPIHLLVPRGIEMALLIFFLSISMTKLCAVKHGYEVDDDQELMSYGICNFGSSFFHCFPSGVGPPRVMILSLLGAKTTLNGIMSVLVMLLVLLFVGHMFSYLPVSVLAMMVIIAIKELLAQVRELPLIFRQSRYDFTVWVITCLSSVLLDMVYGLVFGLIVSLYMSVLQSQRQKEVYLSKSTSEDIFLDSKAFTGLENQADIKIIKPSTSLYYATADQFRTRLYKNLVNPVLLTQRRQIKSVAKTGVHDDSNPPQESDVLRGQENMTDIIDDTQIQILIIDLGHVSYIDSNGVTCLATICLEYKNAGIKVYLCGCSEYVVNALEKCLFFKYFSRDKLFFNLEDAFFSAKAALRP